MKENVKCVKWVLQRLTDNDLYLKPEKCIFWTKEVKYLRMIISENQLQMDSQTPRNSRMAYCAQSGSWSDQVLGQFPLYLYIIDLGYI